MENEPIIKILFYLFAGFRIRPFFSAVRQTHEIRVKAADYDRAQLDRFTITANLLMEIGSHNVAVGLLDPITRASSFTTTRVTVRE